MKRTIRHILFCSFFCVGLVSCYKLQNGKPNYEDGHSTVIHDLPGDTLATDGWDDNYETGDTYLRQRYYTARWTDSIRFVSKDGELINSATGINASTEAAIHWLATGTAHPASVTENDAYHNTADGYHYIYRSSSWYQMDIDGHKGTAGNDSINVNWRGYTVAAPVDPQNGWAYRDNDNGRVYKYNGKAWELMVNDANYNENGNFIQAEYSKSGKEAGIYSIFLFRFSDHKQTFIRDAADSVRYLKTADWDLAFTGDLNSTIWLNNGRSKLGPATGSPITQTSLVPYEYGYEFMDEAPDDDFFNARPANELQIGYTSEFGPGINSWYEIGTTFIAKPFPYKAYYLRLERIDPQTGQHTIRYGKLQLISMYKGAPEVLTDRFWPSPYLTFRYFIQEDGSRNMRTKD